MWEMFSLRGLDSAQKNQKVGKELVSGNLIFSVKQKYVEIYNGTSIYYRIKQGKR